MNAKTKRAVTASRKHWEDNERSFIEERVAWMDGCGQRRWMTTNCTQYECALCKLKGFNTGCDGCVLNQKEYNCCQPYEELEDNTYAGTAKIHHVRAVTNRLREIENE